MTPHTIDREEVMAYMDGELEPTRRAVVEAHVEACDDCRAFAGELRHVSDRLSTWKIADAPDGLADVRRALTTTMATKVPASSWWRGRGLFQMPRWVLAAGTVAVVAIVVTPTVTMQWRSRTERESVMMGLSAEKDARGSARPSVPTTANAAKASEGIALPGQGQGGGGGGRSQLMQRSVDQLAPQSRDRLIVRSATMVLTSDRFDRIRESVEQLTAAQQGRVTSLNLTGDPSSRRSLRATLGVPAARMDALLAGLRGLGRVQDESLGSDDVTEAFRDLTVRTSNARREEQRLVELLSRRTGDLSDVLAVERELARVRLDIERMQAETRATQQRVDLATVSVTVHEQYRADLAIGSLPLPVRFKNALVDGCRQAAEGVVAAALVVLQVVPTLLVWGLILAWPARWTWRRVRALGPL